MMQSLIENMTYRFATEKDCKLYFEWANDPSVRKNAHNSSSINWEEHQRWYDLKLASGTLMLIFFNGSIPIGQIRVEPYGNVGSVDLSVDKDYRGVGVGLAMLNTLIKLVRMSRLIDSIRAEIKKENFASLRTFEKADFKIVSDRIIQGVDCNILECII